MNTADFIVAFIYTLVILFMTFVWRRAFYKNHPMGKFLVPGVVLKIIGAYSIAFIYLYYYKGGDTFVYYGGGQEFNRMFWLNPIEGLKMFFYDAGAQEIDLESFEGNSRVFLFAESFFMAKIVGLCSFLSFNSYISTSILISLFAFSGQWMIFKTFHRKYPAITLQLALVCLFIPSAVFWGSGTLKDPVCLGALGWFFYCMNNIFALGRYRIISILTALSMAYIIFQLKAYILLCFLPCLLIWLYIKYKNRINNRSLRFVVSIFMLVTFIGGALIGLSKLSSISKSYSLSNIEKTAKGFQAYHSYLGEQGSVGSAYDLGEIELSLIGILKKAPAAINVTFFRPYVWESTSIVVLISALESSLFIFFTLWIIYKSNIRGLKKSLNNEDFYLCLLFSLFFGFAVGFTAYNFGALVRFKVPCLPFFGVGLLILFHLSQTKKTLQTT